MVMNSELLQSGIGNGLAREDRGDDILGLVFFAGLVSFFTTMSTLICVGSVAVGIIYCRRTRKIQSLPTYQHLHSDVEMGSKIVN